MINYIPDKCTLCDWDWSGNSNQCIRRLRPPKWRPSAKLQPRENSTLSWLRLRSPGSCLRCLILLGSSQQWQGSYRRCDDRLAKNTAFRRVWLLLYAGCFTLFHFPLLSLTFVCVNVRAFRFGGGLYGSLDVTSKLG